MQKRSRPVEGRDRKLFRKPRPSLVKPFSPFLAPPPSLYLSCSSLRSDLRLFPFHFSPSISFPSIARVFPSLPVSPFLPRPLALSICSSVNPSIDLAIYLYVYLPVCTFSLLSFFFYLSARSPYLFLFITRAFYAN